MKSIIEQIAKGTNSNLENIKRTAKSEELLTELCELDEKIKQNLIKNDLIIYDKVTDLLDAISVEYETESYKEGFKLGFMLAKELFEQ